MKILFYRYGSICEPDIIAAFQKAGLTVIEECREITNKKISPTEQLKLVETALSTEHPLFVFSVNYYPVIARICHVYRTMYLCWTVDSPVLELFDESIKYDTSKIFLFDGAQFDCFAPYNPKNIHHLPLASCVERFDKVMKTITPTDRQRYSNQITFVGSLYNEKNPFRTVQGLSDYALGYINALVETSLKLPGCNLTEAALQDTIVSELKKNAPDFYQSDAVICNPDSYIVAHRYVGAQITETERIRTLNALATHFPVDLYTFSDAAQLENVTVHNGVQTLTEMPKIFHLSKINLNMTTKPIQTGLPLRIFDILGCAGFLMTNYQEELCEHFTIGEDIECYTSMDELLDKCDYYLQHEDIRSAIAYNGYRKVCESHTYSHRIAEMMRHLTQ